MLSRFEMWNVATSLGSDEMRNGTAVNEHFSLSWTETSRNSIKITMILSPVSVSVFFPRLLLRSFVLDFFHAKAIAFVQQETNLSAQRIASNYFTAFGFLFLSSSYQCFALHQSVGGLPLHDLSPNTHSNWFSAPVCKHHSRSWECTADLEPSTNEFRSCALLWAFWLHGKSYPK